MYLFTSQWGTVLIRKTLKYVLIFSKQPCLINFIYQCFPESSYIFYINITINLSNCIKSLLIFLKIRMHFINFKIKAGRKYFPVVLVHSTIEYEITFHLFKSIFMSFKGISVFLAWILHIFVVCF